MVRQAKKLIVVIGMHRTGTSLFTRALQVLGVDLGERLLPAMAEVNAKGFWEDADVNALNIAMLHAISSEWDYLAPVSETQFQQLELGGFFLQAVELLRKKVAPSAVFGLKDPRIAKLLPFWARVFAHCEFDVRYLLTLRHPLSVAKSLHKRDGFSHEKSYLLWFTHVVFAARFAVHQKVSLADYDVFMAHPERELTRLAGEFALSVDPREMAVFLSEFVDHGLRHTHYVVDDLLLDTACPPVVREVYARLLALAAPGGSGELTRIAKSLDAWSDKLGFGVVPFALIDALSAELGGAAQRLTARTQELEASRSLVATLESFNQTRASQVQVLYAATLERDRHIAKLGSQLDDAIRDLEALSTASSRRDGLIAELNQQAEIAIKERGELVARLNQQILESIDERRVQVAQLEQNLAKESLARGHLEAAALQRDSQLGALEQQLRGGEAQIDLLSTEVREREAVLGDLTELLETTRTRQRNVDQQLLEREQQLAVLNADLRSLQRQHQTVLASRSWRVTRPVRLVARLVRHGLIVEDKSRALLALRDFNRALPEPLQRMNRAVFGPWVRSMVARPVTLVATASSAQLPQPVDALQPQVVAAPTSGTDFIVWGVIDWHFRHQRPQQIAQALAAQGDRVFYVSVNLTRAATAGFSVEPLDAQGRLFQVHLWVQEPAVIYHHAPAAEVVRGLLASTGELLLWASAGKIINLVQHPFWFPVAQQLPNSRLVYDCMDHHAGFENTGEAHGELENALLRAADLTITTSSYLDQLVAQHTQRREIIRNAGEFGYFSKPPLRIYQDARGRRIIGYYGAIAEWFDIQLLRQLSERFPECLILLIGSDTVNAQAQLKHQQNIVFTGEVAYQELTHYLYAFDVCLLPFKVIPLILATNPVKIYEYLGAGKPVVAVDIPEIVQFDSLVRVGKDHDDFVAQVAAALAETADPAAMAARQVFARQQTWQHRAHDLSRAVGKLRPHPKVSVIVVTYNNLELTRQCLMSLEKYSDYANSEVIVVDNASADDSPTFLREWVEQGTGRQLILNPDNRGFAAANNQGLLAASGEYLVLLNNDTHVTPGWISTMVRHMQRDSRIGLLGPVTCNIGNEAKINLQYANMDEMLLESSKFTLRHIGQLTPLRTAAFFCVMISRVAYDAVGLLDEAFGIGFFEDDDYCRRVEQAGFRIFCADDVFVHHHLSASFNKLKVGARQELFAQNRVTYEKKWGPWVAHGYRPGVH